MKTEIEVYEHYIESECGDIILMMLDNYLNVVPVYGDIEIDVLQSEEMFYKVMTLLNSTFIYVGS